MRLQKTDEEGQGTRDLVLGRTRGRLAGEDGDKVYDPNSQVRETGGVATGAGTMNNKMKELNSFATNNKKGMQALVMHLVYISNPIDYTIWTENYADLMSSIADSIATYYQVEKSE